MLRLLCAEEALSACEPCYGITSAWGRSELELSPSIFNPNGNPWFIHRKRFDQILRDCVQKTGVLWIDGIALGASFEPDFLNILADSVNIQCKWLVLATGSPMWTARITGEKVIKRDVQTALWGRIPRGRAERLLFLEPSQFGWWYLCPDGGPGSFACLITDPHTAREIGAGNLSNWNALFSSTRLSHGVDKAGIEEIFATPTSVMSINNTQGDRWIAVGDAAAKLDPLGSAGVMTALDGGRRAARAIYSSLRGETLELHNFQKWSTGLVGEFSRQRAQQYLLEAIKHSTNFWHHRADAVNVRFEKSPSAS
jgi:flavin-dependent dehydrogenase